MIAYMVRKYADRSDIDHRTLIAAVYYLHKASAADPEILSWDSIALVFATVLMLAQKFHEDIYVANDSWAHSLQIGGMEVRLSTNHRRHNHHHHHCRHCHNWQYEHYNCDSIDLEEEEEYGGCDRIPAIACDLDRLVIMERRMLRLLQWDLYVNSEQIEHFIAHHYN